MNEGFSLNSKRKKRVRECHLQAKVVSHERYSEVAAN